MPFQAHSTKVILKISIASVMTAIPGVMSISPAYANQMTADATELDDEDTSELPIGRRENKEGKITIKLDPQNAVHAELIDANDTIEDDPEDSKRNFELHYPDTTGLVEAFESIVKMLPKTDAKDFLKAEITIKGTGELTRTIS